LSTNAALAKRNLFHTNLISHQFSALNFARFPRKRLQFSSQSTCYGPMCLGAVRSVCPSF